MRLANAHNFMNTKQLPTHQRLADDLAESDLEKKLRNGFVDVTSIAGGIGGVRIDHDFRATKQLMVEAADEIRRLRSLLEGGVMVKRKTAEMVKCLLFVAEPIQGADSESWNADKIKALSDLHDALLESTQQSGERK